MSYDPLPCPRCKKPRLMLYQKVCSECERELQQDVVSQTMRQVAQQWARNKVTP